MPIYLNTPTDVIRQRIEIASERMRQAVVRRMLYIGEQCVNEARLGQNKSKEYTDQTGNLRSSIGYRLSVNGNLVQSSGFSPVKSEATEGPDKGRSLAEQLSDNYPNSIALVFVAGMPYAESLKMRGYDVIDSAYLLAEALTEQAFSNL